MQAGLNRIERIKSEKDGLKVREELESFASKGFGSITQADLERLKWWGVFWRKNTPELFMLRLRVPGGVLKSSQMRAVAQIAAMGDGNIQFTTRQGIQLRGFKITSVPEALRILEEAGLSTRQTGMDNVHNVMGCPVAGLDRHELIDVSSLVKQVSGLAAGTQEFSNLPRKMLISISGCLDDCAHSGINDLAFTAAIRQRGRFRMTGFNVRVGGMLGPHGQRLAEPLDAFVLPEEVVGLCRAVLELFREWGNRRERSRGRLAFLIEEWGLDRFRAEVERRMGQVLLPAATEHLCWGADHAGVHPQRQHGYSYVGVSVPLGALHLPIFKEVIRLAEEYGRGEIRLTQAQNLIIPHVVNSRIPSMLREKVMDRIPFMPGSLAGGVVACTGAGRCDKGLAHTKSHALRVIKELEARYPWVQSLTGQLRIHFSGCPSSCGQHQIADIGLQGRLVRVGGQLVEAFDVYVGGRLGADARLAEKWAEAVPADKLVDVIYEVIVALKGQPVYKGVGMGKYVPGVSAV